MRSLIDCNHSPAHCSPPPPRRRNGPARPSSASCCRAATPKPRPPTPSSTSRMRARSGCNTIYVGALYGENASSPRPSVTKRDTRPTTRSPIGCRGSARCAASRTASAASSTRPRSSTGASYKFIDTPDHQASRLRSVPVIARLQERSAHQDRRGRSHRPHRRRDRERSGGHARAPTYEHNFTESTKITNKLLAESGSDNTAVQNDIALQVSMTDTLALAVGFGVRYNTDPPPLVRRPPTC